MHDATEPAAFEVAPEQTMTFGRMLSILEAAISIVICELLFDKLIILVLLALIPICSAVMFFQKKKTGLSVCGEIISVNGKSYTAGDITAVKLTSLGNVYIFFSNEKCRIHVSFKNYDRFCSWAGEHGLSLPEPESM